MSKHQAHFILLIVALTWSIGDVAHKTILDHLSPLAAVGVVCLIGGCLTLPFSRFGIEGSRADCLTSLASVTLFFFMARYLEQAAYLTATVTNTGFLIAATAVITPLAAWAIERERPTITLLFAALIAFAGSILLSGGAHGPLLPGDVLALLSATAYAIWMVELGRLVRMFTCHFASATVQFLAISLIILPYCALRGDLEMQAVAAAWPELAVLGVFSTVAFVLQSWAQRYTSASNTAVITSAECVFAAIAAAAILGERITATGFAGGAMILAGVLIAALRSHDDGAETIETALSQASEPVSRRLPEPAMRINFGRKLRRQPWKIPIRTISSIRTSRTSGSAP